MKQLQIIILAQIFAVCAYSQSHMAIFNKCRVDDDKNACRYITLAKEKQDAKEKCGLVIKNKKACDEVKNIEIELGKILSESPDLRTAGADSSDDRIQLAKPDKKLRQPSSENDPNEAEDCDNCG